MAYLPKVVNKLVGRALHRYQMLQDGDRVAVALSGGEDSLVLLWTLRQWQKKAPIRYDLVVIHLDMGFEGHDWPRLKEYLDQTGLEYHFEKTDYGPRAHEAGRETPCFYCSRLRRKRLFELTHSLGCNKLALGHNKDDIIITFFINLFYGAEISTMVPYQELFKGLITLIRPLAFVDKNQIKALARRLELPVIENPCPTAGQTKRAELAVFLEKLYAQNPRLKGNIFRALFRCRPEYLLR
ncbi:tRNA lysidine(34) synthetase [Thermosulfuriphilus sp.]